MEERVWLIQRLEAPRRLNNPFSFGGGFKNGGLSDQAMDLIRGIWSWDYMGAAEFEFGAVPEALAKLAKAAEKNELVAFEVGILKEDIPEGYKGARAEEDAVVYGIAREEDVEEVRGLIHNFAEEDEELKERTRLAAALRNEEYAETLGWLELNNGFMFFIDPDMFEKTKELFAVRVTV